MDFFPTKAETQDTSLEGLYPDFYRQRAVRNSSRLRNPVMSSFDTLVLPKKSIFVHIPTDNATFGPSVRDVPIVGYEHDILVEHITGLSVKDGARPLTHNFNSMVRNYHKRFRKLILVRRIETAIRSDNNLLVLNLGMLNHMYRYQRTMFSAYQQWHNLQMTYIDAVAKYSDLAPERNVFVRVDLPDVLPDDQAYKRVTPKLSATWIDDFKRDEQSMHLLDLWLFVQPDTKLREMSCYSKLPANVHGRMNLLMVSGNKWFMLNLADLATWRDELNMGTTFLQMLDKAFEQKTPIELPEESEEEAKKTPAVAPTATVEEGTDPGYEAPIIQAVADLAERGLLSTGEQKHLMKQATKYKSLKNPVGEGTLADLIEIEDEVVDNIPKTTIPDIPTVFDKSMLESNLINMDRYYNKHLLEKDIANMAMMPQRAGYAVTNYQVEKVVDALNDYKVYTMQFTGVNGSPSTVKCKIPTVLPDGNFKANGVLYHMSPQRGDLPIRKVNPAKVALTSYYGKLFITRGDKNAYNFGTWIQNRITKSVVENENIFTNVRFSNVFSQADVTTRLYAAMAEKFRSFDVNGYQMFWNFTKREEHFGDLMKQVPKDHIPCGKKGKLLVTVDKSDTFYLHAEKGIEAIGTILDLAGVSLGKPPIDTIEMKVFSKAIPLGVILGRLQGIRKIIRELRIRPREVPAGQRYEVASDEFELKFKDATLIISRADKEAMMILGGFNQHKNFIKQHNLSEFDKPDIYFNLLEDAGLGLRYLNEIDLMSTMFVEHITLRILKQMKEPETFEKLLYRSAELLVTSDSPREVDPKWMRIKGHERFSGLMYKSLVDAIRVQKSRPLAAKAKLEVNPQEVWMAITMDGSVNLVEKTNPIHNMREKEILTFSGEGGRSARSMTAPTREFHPNEMGLTSEATADSGKVAINAYASANPKFSNMRGMKEDYDPETDNATNVWSTSALLSPAADRDDPKRINFISIQHDSGVACSGYEVQPFRTGFESVISHRVDNEFAYAALGDGKVIAVDDKHIHVSYKDDQNDDIIELGTFYGTVSGVRIPQRVISDLKVGQTFKRGHILAFNTGYFQRNRFDPSQVDWKAGKLVTTVLLESNDTFEDSSAIYKDIANELSTEITITRSIVVNVKQAVHNLVSVGDKLEDDSVLCTLEDDFTAQNNLFDEHSINTLSLLANAAPRAKSYGTVERLEVFYRADKEDMSKSLQKIVNAADKERAARVKRLNNEEAKTGHLTEMARINGQVLEQDTVIINVYITKSVPAGGGDKAVFGNSLKTVPARVFNEQITTESGRQIDAIFGYRSLNDRIVYSPIIMGWANLLLEEIGNHVVNVYQKG